MFMPPMGQMPSVAPTTDTTSDGGGNAAPPMLDDPEAFMDYLFGHDLTNLLDADYESAEHGEVFVAAPIRIEYIEDGVANGDPQAVTEEAPPVILDLLPSRSEEIVAGTVQFDWGAETYYDQSGVLYRASDDVEAGSIDYGQGTAVLTNPGTAGGSSVYIERMVTSRQTVGTGTLFFRLPGSPIRPGTTSIMVTTVAGEDLVATAGVDGGIQSGSMSGFVDQQNGVVYLSFQETVPKEWTGEEDGPPWYHEGLDIETDEGTYVRRPIRARPQDIRFSTVMVDYLPLEADILGLDPVRLPRDGRVPIYRPGDVVVLSDTKTDELAAGVSAGETYSLTRDDLGYIELRDSEEQQVDSAMYTTDLQAGTVTITDAWNATGYVEPLMAIHRKEEMRMVADVEVTGRVQVTPELTRGFEAGTQVSSAMIIGDLHARVPLVFEEHTWLDEWHNTRQGDRPTGSYDRVNYPIEVTNQDATSERWVIHFTGTDEFEVIGETMGVVATGTTNTDVQPINPATGNPYFVMRSEGFGTGWDAGNAIRFNTKAAHYPIWLLRCIQQGETAIRNDHFTLQLRGDAQ